ncbi:MAG TPA: hypothetical protein VH643_03920 [Gemmataceae bacterium]|jgi:hypothetical protein
MEAALAWFQRWRSLVVIVLVTVPVACLQPWKNGPPIRSDGEGYHLWTRAFLERDLSFRRHAGESGLFLSDRDRDIYQNKYPPGVALLRFPVMTFLVDRRPGVSAISKAEHWANVVFSAAALIAVCYLSLRTCQLLALDASSNHAALLAGVFGTGLFHYGTYDSCFSHVYSALAIAFLLWLGVRTIVRRNNHLPALLTGLVCLLLVLFRNTNIIVLAMMTLAYGYGRHKQGILSFKDGCVDLGILCLGAGSAGCLQLLYNYYARGRFALSSYGEETFFWNHPQQLSVLFSYDRGLFNYYPVVALVLICGWAVRRLRDFAAWFSLLLLSYVVLYGFWSSWQLGCGFGHRGFVELMPLGMVLFAAALSRLSPRWRRCAGVTALLCMAFTLAFMVRYWRGSFPMSGTTAGVYWHKSLLGLFLRHL